MLITFHVHNFTIKFYYECYLVFHEGGGESYEDYTHRRTRGGTGYATTSDA